MKAYIAIVASLTLVVGCGQGTVSSREKNSETNTSQSESAVAGVQSDAEDSDSELVDVTDVVAVDSLKADAEKPKKIFRSFDVPKERSESEQEFVEVFQTPYEKKDTDKSGATERVLPESP